MDPLDTKSAIERSFPHLGQQVGIATSLFALLAAFAGIMSARCTVRATMTKNEAIYVQSVITDAWNYYQAKNIRGELAELFEITTHSAPLLKKIHERKDLLEIEKKKIFEEAKQKEIERDHFNKKSSDYLDASKTFACALVLLQMAVILAPLSLLGRQPYLLHMAVVLSIAGSIYLSVACFQYFHII